MIEKMEEYYESFEQDDDFELDDFEQNIIE